ncbi:MAG: hypothetical protein HN348_00240 [Proteobacteria bacterium]|jgi:hypothetical protein|nr:hypothetical protein [Pseudomonadota bacterium]
MTDHPPILRDVTLTVAVVGVVAGIYGGVSLGVATLIVGSMATINLWLFKVLSTRYVHGLANESDGTVAGLMLVAKFFVSGMVVIGLTLWLGALPVLAGLVCVPLGLALRGLIWSINEQFTPSREV